MADRRVVVNVDDAGVGDGIVFGLVGADIVAVDDGADAFAVDEQVGRGRDFLGGLVGAVEHDALHRHAEDAASLVDFLDGHVEAVLVLDAVDSERTGQRDHLSDLDGSGLLGMARIDAGQRRRAEPGGGGGGG